MNRYNIREFSWYQYVDIGCDPILFNSWKLKEKTGFVLHSAKAAALLKVPEHSRELFANTFEVLTTINDALDFSPLIRITRKDGALIAEQSLCCCGRDEFISQINTISIGKHSVRILPRKNWYTDFHDLKPIRIEWQ